MNTVDNFLKPDKIYGFIKQTSKSQSDIFFISEGRLSIERIHGKTLLNVWANSSHFEMHKDIRVFIPDVCFEILMPINENIDLNKIPTDFYFPIATPEMIDDWEKYFDSTIYQFEHLKIVNCHINVAKTDNDFLVKLRGYITDNIETYSENCFFESEFKAELTNKIETRYNWNYSSKNKDNYHQHKL